jgi:hypothetical protein
MSLAMQVNSSETRVSRETLYYVHPSPTHGSTWERGGILPKKQVLSV